MTRLLLALALFGAWGCQPADRSDSVRAWVLLRDAGTRAYHLGVGDVEHLESLRELRGRDVELRRNSALEVSILTLGGLTADAGEPFALEYSFDESGAVVPGDEDSFHALTLYRNLDRVSSLLRAHGHVPSRRLVVYYLPRYGSDVTGDMRLSLVDNAAYVSAVRGFLIVPTFVLSDLPMVLNEGIIAHEYGHAVVHQEMFGDAEEAPHANDGNSEWVHLHRQLAAMHEGVADLIGFAVTGDPNFIGPTVEAERDLSVPRDLSAQDAAEFTSDPPPDQLFGGLDFDPHFQGSTLARTVYEMWLSRDRTISDARRSALLDATLVALRALQFEPGKFTFASFPDALVGTQSALDRRRMCAVLKARFAPMADKLSNCEGF